MLKNKIFLPFTLLSFLFCSLVACQDDEQEEPIKQNSKNLTLEPSSIEWSLRIDKDSVFKVKISNGKPPYYILQRPQFSSTSYIFKDTLYITPKDPGYTPDDFITGDDFINISDNANNKKTIPINVKPDYFNYTTTSNSNFIISGDTTINFDSIFVNSNPELYTEGFLDKFLGAGELELWVSSARLLLYMSNVKEVANGDTLLNLSIVMYNRNQQPSKRVHFIPTDPSKIRISEVNSKKLKIEFRNISLIDKDNYFSGEAKLNGTLTVEN